MCKHSRHVGSGPSHLLQHQQWGGRNDSVFHLREIDRTRSKYRSGCISGKLPCRQGDPRKGIGIDCLMTKSIFTSRVRCKHILCILFAYFAISAGAEVGETAEHVQLAEESTTYGVLDVKEDSYQIPSSEHSQITRDALENAGSYSADFVESHSQPLSKFDTPGRQKHKTGTHSPTSRKALRSLSSSNPLEEDSSEAENVSHHFIAHLFSRYNDDEYLLIEDLEKMMEHIGLVASVNGSGDPNSAIDRNSEHEHDHDDHSDHHHPEHSHSHEDGEEHQSHSKDEHHDHSEHDHGTSEHDHGTSEHDHGTSEHDHGTSEHDHRKTPEHNHHGSQVHQHQETPEHDNHESHEHDHSEHEHHDSAEHDSQEFSDSEHDPHESSDHDLHQMHEHDHQETHKHHHHHEKHEHDHHETHEHDHHQIASSSNVVSNEKSTSLPTKRRKRRVPPQQHDNHSRVSSGKIFAKNERMTVSQETFKQTVTIKPFLLQCMSAGELLETFGFQRATRLTTANFLHLCPALIDQLDAGYCTKTSASDHSHHDHDHPHEDHTDDHEEEHTSGKASARVWVYALLAVAVISLCSVAGVVVIPNMKRTFYNHTLQFLVALAVGAMSGDAMLHLLPHALLSESHHSDHHHHHDHGADKARNDAESDEMTSHMAGLYKGLVALMGIYCFFFLERLFTLFTKNRSGRRRRTHKKRGPCPDLDKQRSQTFNMVNYKLENSADNTPSCDEMVMVVHPNKALRAYADVSHEAFLHRCDESLVLSPSGHEITGILSNGNQLPVKDETIMCHFPTPTEGMHVEGPTKTVERETAIMSDAEILGVKESEPVLPAHTHSHSHSHMGQNFRGSLSSVAMMVVIGDMVHNFCDGLAIGAAFAGSIAGGLSTSVAVFCHELPHEIGDFAVLVRSGLTLRKAVFFNLFSSVPCFIGTIIGLVVGNLASTSLWIFAAVGGMFLYITLVDLIPEMSSVYTKCGEPWFLHLLLQASGIALGTTIMLVISVAEESLLTAF